MNKPRYLESGTTPMLLELTGYKSIVFDASCPKVVEHPVFGSELVSKPCAKTDCLKK